MSNILYGIALVLLLLWAIGFLGYNMGGFIHLLLIIALISVLFRVIRGERLF